MHVPMAAPAWIWSVGVALMLFHPMTAKGHLLEESHQAEHIVFMVETSALNNSLPKQRLHSSLGFCSEGDPKQTGLQDTGTAVSPPRTHSNPCTGSGPPASLGLFQKNQSTYSCL